MIDEQVLRDGVLESRELLGQENALQMEMDSVPTVRDAEGIVVFATIADGLRFATLKEKKKRLRVQREVIAGKLINVGAPGNVPMVLNDYEYFTLVPGHPPIVHFEDLPNYDH